MRTSFARLLTHFSLFLFLSLSLSLSLPPTHTLIHTSSLHLSPFHLHTPPHTACNLQAARAGQLPQQLASRGAGGAAGGMLMMGASGAAGAYGYAPARPAAGEQTMVIEV